MLARARLGLSLRPKFCFKNNKRIITGPVTKTLFFPSYRRRSIPAGTRRGDAGGTGGVQRHDSGGGAGESAPAGLTKMAATMKRFVAVVKQYPGQQQVDLAVEIEVPGSWFCAGPMGSLTAMAALVGFNV